MSSYKHVKPCLILVHADYIPFGPYWEYLLEEVPNIIHIAHQPVEKISGKAVHFVEHKADYARLKAVKRKYWCMRICMLSIIIVRRLIVKMFRL